ncbi:MAG: hypothetical protein PHX45_05370 [Acidobacteriota bacterium]|nr:hypothetical protein [Acidobacteriota bacterium]
MEELEVLSWLTLDSIKKSADIVETVGNLQTDHNMSVFVVIEDDLLELCYSDSAANYLRRYEDRDEFDAALEQRKEEVGEAFYDEDQEFDKDEGEGDELEEDASEEDFETGDESDGY